MNGIIDSTGVYEVGNVGQSFRCTLALTSADAGRLIEISIDHGENWFVPQLDVEEPGVIGVVIKAAMTNYRFTGTEGDKWGVLA